MLERNFWFRAVLVVAFFSATVFLLSIVGRVWGFLGDLIVIIFLAYLVGSLLIHVVNSLMRIPHMRRPLAVLIVYMALITLIADFAFLVIPATVDQVIDLAEIIPGWVDRVPEGLTAIEGFLARFGIEVDIQAQLQLSTINDFATTVAEALTDNALSIFQNVVSLVFAVGLVVVISFYIVLDGGRRLNEALKVLPPKAEHETRFVLRTIDETFHGYIRGMLVVSMIYGVGTAAVMLATGLPAALPTAIMSSILLAVPFIGDWLALALPLLVAGISGDFITLLVVLAALLFIQQIMLNLLTPRILGHAVRMPAMLVIIAVVLGARLAGISGALLGVPTTGVLYTLAVTYGTRIRERREAREAAERGELPESLAEESSPAVQPPPQQPNASGIGSTPYPIAGGAPSPQDEDARST